MLFRSVFRAFFDPADLAVWWQAAQAVTTAVPTGVYALQFPTTPYRDDLLGPLGGTLFGTMIDVTITGLAAAVTSKSSINTHDV